MGFKEALLWTFRSDGHISRGCIEVHILEIIVAKKVSFYCLASPTNRPNLLSVDEEVCQILLPMHVGIIYLMGVLGYVKWDRHDDVAPTPALLFRLDITKCVEVYVDLSY